MNEHDQRIAMNEALLREVNERIRDVGKRLQVLPDNEELDFRCECGRPECDEFLHMKASDYQRVRADNDRFAVLPRHEDAKIERVVAQGAGYLVVDKRPEVEPLVGADGEPDSGASGANQQSLSPGPVCGNVTRSDVRLDSWLVLLASPPRC